MTNAPETRKTHVIRILGTNKAGDVLPDIWADVERIDAAKSVYQSDETSFQGTVRRLKWQDDPDQDDYNPDGPASRKMRVLKVCSPDEEDPSDPKEWIPIPVIDEMRSVSGDQGGVRRFINDKPTDSRIVVQRRILHYDTSIDDQAQAAFDADPSRKAFVVPGDQYTRDDSTKDDSQYVEHEIITFLKGQVSDESGTGQGDDQGQQTKLLNQYLIDESEAAKLAVVGSDGFNPPWRLDPYQNIVNVQLGGATEIEAGSRQSGNLGSVTSTKISLVICFRIKSLPEVDGTVLLEFGNGTRTNPFTSQCYDRSFVRLEPGAALFTIQLAGAHNSYTVPEFVPGHNNWGTDPGDGPQPGTPVVQIGNAIDAPPFEINVWNLIAVSLDTTSLIGGPEDFFPLATGAVNISRIADPSPETTQIADLVQFIYTSPTGGGGEPGSDIRITATDPSVTFPVALGGEFGIPAQVQNMNMTWNADVDYGPLRLWTDYIDFSDPAVIAKFVVANPNTSDTANPFLMVAPSVAEAAFGKPLVFLNGPPKSFLKNGGSGLNNFVENGDGFKRIAGPR